MRFKYFFPPILCSIFLTTTKAETIHFQGAIVEDSCSSASTNIECKNLTKAIKRAYQGVALDSLLRQKFKDTALIYITNTQMYSQKVLVINYH
ncbi:hypothetical protein B9T31_14355 [Acinetobacter sp. ANC 4558]|nr:hypothetical protein B9T31_14355 [Acinetobacter sp. ANC 4558]